MRADYIQYKSEITEIQRLEAYWDENWQKIGNQRRKLYRLLLGPEIHSLRKYAPIPSPLIRCLDGGCGLGEWCLLLSKKGYTTYGVDIIRSLVERLTQECPAINFTHSDIRHMPYDDNFFDFYISWGTFEHFEEGLTPCFKEAYRILKPGGLLFITVPFYNQRLLEADAISKTTLPNKDLAFYQWRLSKDELREHLVSSSFTCLELKPIHIRQGLQRHLHQRFNMKYGLLNKILATAISPFVKKERYAHMLLAVAKKT